MLKTLVPNFHPDLSKITLIIKIINKNGSLVFEMRMDHFVRTSLRREEGRNFKFKYLSERG